MPLTDLPCPQFKKACTLSSIQVRRAFGTDETHPAPTLTCRGKAVSMFTAAAHSHSPILGLCLGVANTVHTQGTNTVTLHQHTQYVWGSYTILASTPTYASMRELCTMHPPGASHPPCPTWSPPQPAAPHPGCAPAGHALVSDPPQRSPQPASHTQNHTAGVSVQMKDYTTLMRAGTQGTLEWSYASLEGELMPFHLSGNEMGWVY
jgi:hypothetical protein